MGGQLKHVCLDKTGTLTVGEFKLLDLDVFGKNSKREDVLQYLALMEERATHPLATSLVDGIKSEGITISKSLFVKDHTFLAGEGVILGSYRWYDWVYEYRESRGCLCLLCC